MFSLLQCIVSPLIGKLSDHFGRRKVLLYCMLGNIFSCFLWIFAKRFPIFLLSRVIGGLSEGNVQLSVSMISDLTSKKERSRGLALVGIAFALGFTLGPAFGGILASLDVQTNFLGLNPFSLPAILAFVLVSLEFFYILSSIPETQTLKKHVNTKNNKYFLCLVHFLYLFLFSGIEFTFPFLYFEKFSYSNKQQGLLFAFIGVTSAVIQATYTRRHSRKIGEVFVAIQGILAASMACLIMSIYPQSCLVVCLLLAFASATVITMLTSLFSQGDDSGKNLGNFRAFGQFGRASGPLALSASYWLLGPKCTYFFCSLLLSALVPLIFIRVTKSKID